MLDDIREWISDNLRYILLGVAGIVLLLLIVGIIRLVAGSGKKKDNPPAESPKQVEEITEVDAADNNAADAGDSNSGAAVTDTTPADTTQETHLSQDDAAVLTLMKEYYNAVAAGDTATLSKIVEPWNSDVEADVMSNTMIESYNNISTYSASGPDEGSYVAFVYYEGKMEGIDTLAPSLVRYYLKTNDAGDLVIEHGGVEDHKEFVAQLTNQTEVKDLIADVQAKLQAAREEDSALNSFLAAATPEGSGSGQEGAQNASAASGKQMTANGELNIRQTPSTDASIMGVVMTGTNVTVLEDAGDGWAHIIYSMDSGDIEGYVRLEYLTEAQ